MGPFDNLITSSTTIHRFKLLISAGLEKLLVKEISRISNQCAIVAGGQCYIDAQASLDNIWKLTLSSRLSDQLWMHVCEPFPAKNVRTFVRTLNSAEWKGYIPFSANLPLPYVRVNTNNSSLYHTGMTKKIVHEVIKGHCHRSLQLQGDDLPVIMKRRGHLPLCPQLMVNVDNDMCEVLANSSGDLFERPWLNTSAMDPRIRPSAVSALALRIDLERIITERNISTIWDPFCHNGSLLLEIYSLLQGHHLRHPDHVYPLNNFPLNSRQLYLDVLESIGSTNMVSANVRLLGTDVFEDHVSDAISCLEKYRQSGVQHNTPKQNAVTQQESTSDDYNTNIDPPGSRSLTSTGEISIEFSPVSMSQCEIDPCSTMIITNLYYGNKAMQKQYVEAQKQFENFLANAPRSLLQNVYVVSTDGLRRRSRFEWEPELRFNNGGILVTLLRLKGVKR
ncbi:RNA methylase family UPF0020, putative [Babesia ovis]|uniref:RNA methylase family UPF0020, putative n=1 Tax=Babesia ovis TaxID=5869 RepID=A0A9W5T8Z8_BABOV|nr:RNA methylase family UPF0020, putative [Babesia ovis]